MQLSVENSLFLFLVRSLVVDLLLKSGVEPLIHGQFFHKTAVIRSWAGTCVGRVAVWCRCRGG